MFENTEDEIKAGIAAELNTSWQQIEQDLYADVMEYQRLMEFEGYPDPAALLSRYNVAQLQASLYRAETVKIWAQDDFKTILRYAKLARLLHEIKRTGPPGYEITLSGPVSVLHETRRYGICFARFLPALLACKGWKMSGTLKTAWQTTAKLNLSCRDGFTSHLPPPREFDSSLEEGFAEKFGPERNGWQLIREGAILHENQSTFVPDFVFRHNDGTEVLMEIIGFWTPQYLAHRRETLQKFRQHNIIFALPQSSLKEQRSIPDNFLIYKKAILIKPVMDALEKYRQTAD